MPVPVKSKTWQYNCDNASPPQGSALLSNKRIFRLIKDAMIGFASSPWVVKRSSNAVVANTSDNWASDSDIVAGGGAHSWMVLEQAGIGPGFQVCFDLNSAGSTTASIIISPSAGFTGGTTAARPTATDEIPLVNLGTWTNNGSDIQIRWSVMQSTDGECTRILLAAGGAIVLLAVLDKPASPVTGWATPGALWWSVTQTVAYYITTYNGRMRHGSVIGSLAMTVEGAAINAPSDTAWGNIPNEISSEWSIFPLGIACNTAGARGRHAALADLWAGSIAVATGQTYPLAANDFVQVGPLVLPWNGGPVNLS